MIRYNHDQKKITQNNTAKIIVTNVEHHHASSSIHKNKRNKSKINQKKYFSIESVVTETNRDEICECVTRLKNHRISFDWEIILWNLKYGKKTFSHCPSTIKWSTTIYCQSIVKNVHCC